MDVRKNLNLEGPLDRHPRRLGPRPLGMHIARAEMAWRAKNPRELARFYRGINAYRYHPYRRGYRRRPVIWEKGRCQLLDYGPDDGWPLLVLPSLINRAYILDLMPNGSLLEFLSGNGIRPFLLDWGTGIALDRQYSLEDLVLERLAPSLRHIQLTTHRRPLVLGYCMGGTLAVSLACIEAGRLAGLALLATPWNFHIPDDAIKNATSVSHTITSLSGLAGGMPIDLLQALFAQIEPMGVPRKFAQFANLSSTSQSAIRFVAIEDWLNDGVPLSAEVAFDCLVGWYARNGPASGSWRLDGIPIRPDKLDLPAWLAIPEHDRIVPARSSLPLAHLLNRCEIVSPKGGHISMVAGLNAETSLWKPLLHWLKRVAAMQKSLGKAA